MKTKKEHRVYILSADEDDKLSFNINGYEIENWAHYQDHHPNEQLPANAENFISVCEEFGRVYSLSNFQIEFNLNEGIGMNEWIFITNNY